MISSRKEGPPLSAAMSLASKARRKADQSSNSLVLASLRFGRTCSSMISPSLRRMTLVRSSFQSSLQWIQCTLPSFTPARSWASACRVVTCSRWDCRSGWAWAAISARHRLVVVPDLSPAEPVEDGIEVGLPLVHRLELADELRGRLFVRRQRGNNAHNAAGFYRRLRAKGKEAAM